MKILSGFFVAMTCLAIMAPARAQDIKAGNLVIEQPWARASITKNGAAYLTIVNNGTEIDRLTSASTPVAKKAELHTHQMDGGVMRMRPVEALEVHPGEPTVLQPGGLHIMLMDLTHPLKQGDHFDLTLNFDHSGKVVVPVVVLGVGSMRMGPRNSGSMPMGNMPMGNAPASNMPMGNMPMGNTGPGKMPMGNMPMGSPQTN